ncbi:MAG: hypothetical protein ABIH52_03105 [Candidatus Aenigmatarchaeota archaeon]
MNKYILAIVLGIVLWAIAYVAAIPLLAYQAWIHSFESIVMALFGMLFALWYFFQQKGNYMKEGLMIGIVWMVIGWILDYVALLPFMGVTFEAYFASIGLTYVSIPIGLTIFGWALDKKVK